MSMITQFFSFLFSTLGCFIAVYGIVNIDAKARAKTRVRMNVCRCRGCGQIIKVLVGEQTPECSECSSTTWKVLDTVLQAPPVVISKKTVEIKGSSKKKRLIDINTIVTLMQPRQK